MQKCGFPGCTDRSTIHHEKRFHRLPSISKKEYGTSGWQKLIKYLQQKNYLSPQTTFNLNVLKGISSKT